MLDFSSGEVRFAIEAVQRAVALTRAVSAGTEVLKVTKADLSPVTVADFGAQAVVAQWMDEVCPDETLVGEESAADLRTSEGAATLESVTRFVQAAIPGAAADDVCAWVDRGTADPCGRFWTLDPLDGTKGYLRGDQYVAALALIENGQVRLGVLGCPNLGAGCRLDVGGPGTLVLAVRGEGAAYAPMDGDGPWTPMRVSACDDVRQARLMRSFEAGHTNTGQIGQLAECLGVEAEPVRMDSQAKYAVMASGGGELLFRLLSPKQPDYREKIWDQAAGSIVIEEAGGRISDLAGKPLDFSQGRRLERNRGVVASNGLLHDAALEALARIGAA